MPDADDRPTPVLLVHGAWHGAWCWGGVLQALLAAGHPAVAIDTPGHGPGAPLPEAWRRRDPEGLTREVSALATMSLADHVGPVVEAVRRLHEACGRVLVVGHSLAGVTLHEVGEQVPEALAGLVYLAAIAPGPGRTAFDDAAGPAWATSLFGQLLVADPAATGVVRVDWRSDDEAYRAVAQEAFYGDVPEPLRSAATRLLTPDEPASLYATPAGPTAGRWGSVPRAFIRCTQDRAVPVEAQDAAIAALDEVAPAQRFVVRTMQTSHSPFLSAPAELAALLVELARGGR